MCFPHFESRRHEHVQQALGLDVVSGGLLLTDGYAAYERYARKSGITHAQCWTHARRGFFEAQDAEPQAAAEALRRIAPLYEIEEEIRCKKLTGEANGSTVFAATVADARRVLEFLVEQHDFELDPYGPNALG